MEEEGGGEWGRRELRREREGGVARAALGWGRCVAGGL